VALLLELNNRKGGPRVLGGGGAGRGRGQLGDFLLLPVVLLECTDSDINYLYLSKFSF